MLGATVGRVDQSEEISQNVLSLDKVPLLIQRRLDGSGKIDLGNLVHLNVSGRMFIIDRAYLEQYPSTLLGSSDLEDFWEEEYEEYFFDIHRDAFESIFDFYLYGKLYPHPHVPAELHADTIEFFRIMTVFEEQEANEAAAANTKKPTWYAEFKRRLHKTLEDPSYHVLGKIWGWLDLLFIGLSIVTMLIETIPKIHAAAEIKGSRTGVLFFVLESATVVFFTFDVSIRCFAYPERLVFLKAPATWLDIMTIAPFFVELFIDFSKLESMKVLRIARVARVLKLIKKNKKLQLIADVLIKSVSELCMLVIVWAMNITVAGVIFYYLEGSGNSLITSAVDGMWWAMVTMSTVGYGDLYPTTTGGKLFSTMFIWMSMVFLALPLTIIVSTFNKQYEIKKTLTLKQKGAVTKSVPVPTEAPS